MNASTIVNIAASGNPGLVAYALQHPTATLEALATSSDRQVQHRLQMALIIANVLPAPCAMRVRSDWRGDRLVHACNPCTNQLGKVS